MNRSYAALRLLEHGPLKFAEIMEITGWSESCCRKVLCRLHGRGEIHRTARGKSGEYQIGASEPWTGMRGARLTDCIMRGFACANLKLDKE